MQFIRQGATHKVVVGPAVAVGDGFTPVTTLDVSTADEAEVILHDNGTVVDISGYTWAAIATADGYYHLTLASGISGTVGHMTVVVNDDSLCLPVRADFTVLEEAAYDQLFAGSAPGAATPTALATAQSDLDTITGTGGVLIGTDAMDRSGTLDVNTKTVTANAITAAAINDAAIDAATFAADTDTYMGTINVAVDGATGPTDRYGVSWYKNGVYVTSMTSQTITVEALGGAQLINAQAMTEEAGLGGTYYYNATGAELMTAGVIYGIKCVATISGSDYTAVYLHCRDTSA